MFLNTKHLQKTQNTLLIFIVFIFFSCKKNQKPEINNSQFSDGIICMNEGLFQQNNASLSYYSTDSSKTDLNVFSSINGRGLGDTANDMIEYDFSGKSYIAIAVDISSQIEILDATTLKSVKQIPIFNGTNAREPRALKYYQNYLYSINFDGTVSQIDLLDYSIVANIKCGQNPERAEIINNNMYVINSGGLNYPAYDSTISIINLNTNLVISSFKTAINCSEIVKDFQDEIYLISRGNYNNIPPSLLRINSGTNSVIQIYNIPLTTMTYYNNQIYYYNELDLGIHLFNTSTETIDNNVFIDCSNFKNLYRIQIDEINKLIYLLDANDYVNSSIIRCYDIQGNYKYQFTAGLNTGKLIFK